MRHWWTECMNATFMLLIPQVSLVSMSMSWVTLYVHPFQIYQIMVSRFKYSLNECVKGSRSGIYRGLQLVQQAIMLVYSIHVPGWLLKWLNLITAHSSVSNEPGSVTWLATKYLKTVSWRNHTEKLTTLWPQNISFWPKINIPSSYFTILMLNCLENTLKLQFDSYVTAVKFLT